MSVRQTQQRRRSNVLFVLVLIAVCSLFLAVTTQVTAAVYIFALAFLALGGYVYMLGQARQAQGAEPRAQPSRTRSRQAQRDGGSPHRPSQQRAPQARARREHAPPERQTRRREGVPGERWLDIA